MMLFIPVVQGNHPDDKSQEYHEQLKIQVVYDVDTQHRQAGEHQREHGAMYGTCHRSSNSKRIIVDPEHPVKIWGAKIRVFCNKVAIELNHVKINRKAERRSYLCLMSKTTWIYLLFFLALVGGFYVFLLNIIDTSKSTLPVLSNVKPFSFFRQDGETVSEKGVEGKVYVTEYFFTTCQGICPRMNTNMKKVYDELKNEQDFMILSHTVDPKNDSIGRLRVYADSLGANVQNWWFLTGSKEQLYKAARESYAIDDPKNNAANIEEDFLHTQFFALVDKDRRVRGVYDGLKSKEIKKLISDAKELLQEDYTQ